VNLLKFFKPAEHKPEIADKEKVNSLFKYWRLRTFAGMYMGYVFYYFTRKSYTFAMPLLMADSSLNLSLGQLGILGSVLSMTYGLSKFFSGVMADKSNPRYFMAFGLILTGLCNIAFGMSSSVALFTLFWGLNGWFQGWGWPPCAKLLTSWYSQKERGRWWGLSSTSHSVGGALIPIIAAICANLWGWRYAMYMPGAMCIVVGLILIKVLRDTPQSLGLPSVERWKNEISDQKAKEDDQDLSVKEILMNYVLKNKSLWLLGVAYFFVYIIRQAINDWSLLFLMQSKGYSSIAASGGVFWFEMGGVLGALLAGWTSDRLFQGRRGPVNVLFCVGVVFALVTMLFIPSNSLILHYIVTFIVGIMIFGPQMLIGIAAVEIAHKKAAASANGFIGWLAYLGAACAGYPIGKVIEIWGWGGFFTILSCCGVLAVLLLSPFWKKQKVAQEVVTT
jgi:OPA family sugar phosphate sensor protein UhpC-like MFS transporter